MKSRYSPCFTPPTHQVFDALLGQVRREEVAPPAARAVGLVELGQSPPRQTKERAWPLQVVGHAAAGQALGRAAAEVEAEGAGGGEADLRGQGQGQCSVMEGRFHGLG